MGTWRINGRTITGTEETYSNFKGVLVNGDIFVTDMGNDINLVFNSTADGHNIVGFCDKCGYGKSMTSITFNINHNYELGQYCFAGCINLNDVYFSPHLQTYGGFCFYGDYNLDHVYRGTGSSAAETGSLGNYNLYKGSYGDQAWYIFNSNNTILVQYSTSKNHWSALWCNDISWGSDVLHFGKGSFAGTYVSEVFLSDNPSELKEVICDKGAFFASAIKKFHTDDDSSTFYAGKITIADWAFAYTTNWSTGDMIIGQNISGQTCIGIGAHAFLGADLNKISSCTIYWSDEGDWERADYDRNWGSRSTNVEHYFDKGWFWKATSSDNFSIVFKKQGVTSNQLPKALSKHTGWAIQNWSSTTGVNYIKCTNIPIYPINGSTTNVRWYCGIDKPLTINDYDDSGISSHLLGPSVTTSGYEAYLWIWTTSGSKTLRYFNVSGNAVTRTITTTPQSIAIPKYDTQQFTIS